ncbi:MAG TPA: DUF3341 domain-containing protein [Polyangiaceae bacterium]|nr:DUF3341 domain-containing protein [Polyangiaceae bacterium]
MARILAEFETPDALAYAIEALRARGYRELDAYTPYSTEEVREALAWRRSRLSWFVLLAACFGGGGAYFLQWYLVGFLYPLNVGGRPAHMPLAFVPISFEMAVLGGAIAAFVSVLWGGRLLRWWDPVFEVGGFESASIDRFWLELRATDPRFDLIETPREVEELKPLRQLLLGGVRP